MLICETSLGWHQRTARRVSSHPVVILLCIKLDAECDRQATVVGRLLTLIGDDRHAIAKVFLVQRMEKTSEKITLMFGHSRISYLFDKYFSSFRALSPRPEALDLVEAQSPTLCVESWPWPCQLEGLFVHPKANTSQGQPVYKIWSL